MTRRRVFHLGAVAALALVVGAGCATLSGQTDSLNALQESVEAYNDAYRWKNYERASLFRPADVRAAFLATYEEDDKSLHVEDYQILKAEVISETAARIVVRLRFMQLPSVTLENRKLVQHWHKVGGRWILETEENSVREIDMSAMADNPDAFGGSSAEAPPGDPNAEVEVTDPEGNVIRQDGKPTNPNEPAPAEPAPADDE